MTPSSFSKGGCMHQKHPPAKVAVARSSVPAAAPPSAASAPARTRLRTTLHLAFIIWVGCRAPRSGFYAPASARSAAIASSTCRVACLLAAVVAEPHRATAPVREREVGRRVADAHTGGAAAEQVEESHACPDTIITGPGQPAPAKSTPIARATRAGAQVGSRDP